MYCPKCGNQNPDTALFCQTCGANVGPDAAPAPSYNAAPGYAPNQNYAPNPGYVPAPPRQSPVDVLKISASSPKFLAAAILTTASIILSLISSLTFASTVTDYLMNFTAQLGGDAAAVMAEIQPYLDTVGSYAFGATFAALIPSMIMAIGVWLIWLAGKNTAGSGMNTTGLTITKIMTIINTIGIGIGALAVLGFVVLGGASVVGTGGENAEIFAAVFGVFGFIIMAVFIFEIVYNVFIIKSISAAINTVRNGYVTGKISAFVGAMLMLSGISGALSALGNFVQSPLMGISSAVGAAASILFALVLFEAKRGLEAVSYHGV